jgi:hypothetical protein
MSAIDQYKHELLTFIECPSEYDFVYTSSTRKIAVYRLDEDVPADEVNFDGRKGDILIGGGSGEAEALRVSHPEAMLFLKGNDGLDIECRSELVRHFWSPSFAYKIGNGFGRIGWNPDASELEWWVAETVIDMLLSDGFISMPECRDKA